jgi:hypothetical protein
VKKAALATMRRIGDPLRNMLVVQGNIANTYRSLGRLEEASRILRDVYSGRLKLNGEEHTQTFTAANNYALCLGDLKRFEEAKKLLRKTWPVARRVLGEGHEITLKMGWSYAAVLPIDSGATLDDLREAVTTLEEIERTARRVFGGAHPRVRSIERSLQVSRACLQASEDA